MQKKSLKLNMVLNTIKGIAGIIFPLITFPYVSKILGVSKVGEYNFANSIISYLILIAGLGISTYAIREGARFRENTEKFQHFSDEMFTINVISTALSYILLVFLIILVPKFDNYSSLLVIISMQIFFKTIGIEWIYSIFEDYAYITIRSIIFQFISLLLLFVFVKSKEDLLLYALITSISSGGSGFFNYFYAKKYCKVKLTKNINWNKHVKPILILFAMSAASKIYISSDVTVLGFLSGDFSVGIYSVSTKIYYIVDTILASVLVVSIPRLSSLLGHNEFQKFNEVASDIYQTLLSLVVPSIIGIILIRKEIILIIANDGYITATKSLYMLSIALFFTLGSWFWAQCVLIPFKQENVVFKATFLAAIVNIILNIILIPFYKENGAAFSTIVAEFIVFSWCRKEGLRYVKLDNITSTLIKVFIGCIPIFIITLFIKTLINNMILELILILFVAIPVYFIIEIFLKNKSIISFSHSFFKR
ncbi:oligosaccharide flippase family protein [Lactococcus lactis]|uniref:oligosaccharide flippase family protein n=1 Tax=Lactococcus lactis TaxID=1358 RepID=UPI00288F33DC|nr:oligosaccharide flippase family protein [Lactococcus lactis]MDT2905200.1 oligosaccharide flippase family protein [Lactococcus lactis]